MKKPSTVFIINGRPRAGKDTLQEYMARFYNVENAVALTFSSIDPVRNAVTKMGIDVSSKTPADRLLLATVGSAVEAHSEFRTNACVEYVETMSHGMFRAPVVVFLMIREADMIERVRQKLMAQGHKVYRVMVTSPRAELPTNKTDADVEDMPWDYLVQNNGTLQHLQREALSLIHLVQAREGMKHAS